MDSVINRKKVSSKYIAPAYIVGSYKGHRGLWIFRLIFMWEWSCLIIGQGQDENYTESSSENTRQALVRSLRTLEQYRCSISGFRLCFSVWKAYMVSIWGLFLRTQSVLGDMGAELRRMIEVRTFSGLKDLETILRTLKCNGRKV